MKRIYISGPQKTNELLVAALRWCPSHGCGSCVALDANGICVGHGIVGITHSAADLIEAQQKQIAELEAQLPKEGEWIDMGDFEMCSVCKIAQRKKYRQYHGGFMWVRTDFCGNCGSRMAKGEQG